jgi:hypothetical protein
MRLSKSLGIGAVDDPTEILLRRIDGATFQQPIHLLDDVQPLR